MTNTKLHSALILFREKIETVKKTEDNPFFKSKYADLPSILEAIKTPLKESGLSLAHYTARVEDSLELVTVLTHAESGESIQSVFPVFGSKPQEIGSSMTYARRYNTQALLDIPTDDDDGNTANMASKTQYKKTETTGKPWYNGFEKEKGLIEDAIVRGDCTAQEAIDRLETKYRVNSTVKAEILKFKK